MTQDQRAQQIILIIIILLICLVAALSALLVFLLNRQPETPTQPTPGANTTFSPPPPTSTLMGNCVDDMAFITDLTYPDYNMTAFTLVPPNTPFRKGWRIRNIGSCTWNSSYVLGFVDGNPAEAVMGGTPTSVVAIVPPGGDYDLYVDLVSPAAPGVYQAYWALTNPKGKTFGERLRVAIQVPEGISSTIPAQPTQPAGTTASPQQSAPAIYIFEVYPNVINEGECTYLKWEILGNVDQVRILRNGLSIWDNAPAKYALTECPPGVSIIVYEIQAIGPNGTARDVRQLMINPAQNPTPLSALPFPPFAEAHP